ncbi:Eukaryotic translation initiation factor 5B [Aphelenchoides fujianensis]|nr:Eukaryotic translation initiation factor 5B [Aphelenchoides fujianensis]
MGSKEEPEVPDVNEEEKSDDEAAENEAGEPEDAPADEPAPAKEATPDAAADADSDAEGADGDDGPPNETAEERKKRKKKEKAKEKKAKEKQKGKDEDEGEKKGKKKNNVLKELLRLRMEAEEQAKREEEERIRQEEELKRQQEEQERLEQQRKEEAKRRKEEKIAEQKREGKYLTKKQREEQERNRRLFLNKDIVRPPGLQDDSAAGEASGEQKKKPILYGKKKPNKKAAPEAAKPAVVEQPPEPKVEEVAPPPPPEEPTEERQETPESDVVDDWEQISEKQLEPEPVVQPKPAAAASKKKPAAAEAASSSDESSDGDDSSDESDDAEEEAELQLASHDVVRARLKKRREEAEARRTTDNLRSPVICVLGHVDTGKTKMLDTIRRTNVQDAEAGGITQQIGATRIPDTAIQERCRHVRDFDAATMRIPGFLVIDTPGHESFANLRSRGSSLCDFAILVVDIMHGLEQQTIESLQLLLKRRTPFVVALNKVDRLYGYESNPRKDIWQHLRAQPQNTQLEFKKRWDETVLQFNEQGMNVALAKDNKDPNEYISVVPTSAFHGDGIGNLMAHIVDQSQTRLAQRLAYCDELDCTVMEVRPLEGMGKTIDVVLLNGRLRVNDFLILAGTKGPIVTMVRDLLMPAPLKEIRVKNEYEHYKEIKGAQGVKILAKDLDHAIAGLPLYATNQIDEVNVFKEDVQQQLEQALTAIKTKPEGVCVQASTLGSLEALLEFLKTQKIPYSNVNIGPVHKKDVQKAAVMLEHNSEFACILAFDVPVDRDVQQFADREGVRIFQADIIYHLEDSFLKYREELKQKRRKENEHLAIFPCRLRVLPQHIFNARNPIVLGVSVEAGKLKKGTPIVAKTPDDVVFLGTVTSIEHDHNLQDMARAGDEVSIKIENTTGEAPKLYGRHFTHTDPLVSRISRQSIDACKNFFRDDLSKDDWSLVIQLKKMLKIM